MRTFLRNTAGAAGAEFALILPVLLILLLGVIDAGRFGWDYNRAEKATQVGARMAIVTTVLDSSLMTTDYVGADMGGGVFLTQGDRIPTSAYGTLTCNSGGCSCTSGSCGTLGTFNQTAFDNIVARMQQIDPTISSDDVSVEYKSSGLGFAGAPNIMENIGGTPTQVSGMDMSPLVTVSLSNMTFRPIFLFNQVALPMPDFATTLSEEDGYGTVSN